MQADGLGYGVLNRGFKVRRKQSRVTNAEQLSEISRYRSNKSRGNTVRGMVGYGRFVVWIIDRGR